MKYKNEVKEKCFGQNLCQGFKEYWYNITFENHAHSFMLIKTFAEFMFLILYNFIDIAHLKFFT